MIFVRFAFLMGLLLGFFSASTWASSLHDSTVYIVSVEAAGNGVIVASDGKRSYILTAAHIASTTMPQIYYRGELLEEQPKIVTIDNELDIAILAIDREGLRAVKLGEPQRGQHINIVSFLRCCGATSVSGQLLFPWQDGTWLVATYFMSVGMSGSGVFADDKLVCMVHQMGIQNEPQRTSHFGWCVPSTLIAEMMGRAKISMARGATP